MADSDKGRRRFLSFCTDLLLAVIGLAMAVPALRYVWAPLGRKSDEENVEPLFEDVGPIAEIPLDEWRLLSVEVVRQDGWDKSGSRHGIWVRRSSKGDHDLMVLSSICPHLGCPVNWYPSKSEFVCPCHGGTFDANGRHIGGPPPRSLDPLKFEVRNGRLRVRWQDFKIGIAESVPVNV